MDAHRTRHFPAATERPGAYPADLPFLAGLEATLTESADGLRRVCAWCLPGTGESVAAEGARWQALDARMSAADVAPPPLAGARLEEIVGWEEALPDVVKAPLREAVVAAFAPDPVRMPVLEAALEEAVRSSLGEGWAGAEAHDLALFGRNVSLTRGARERVLTLLRLGPQLFLVEGPGGRAVLRPERAGAAPEP